MQVAREVFNNCLMGELKEKTRILVTNQLQFVSPADIAIFMANGKIAEIGTYAELVANGDQFASLMSQAEVQTLAPRPLLSASIAIWSGKSHWYTKGLLATLAGLVASLSYNDTALSQVMVHLVCLYQH